MFNSRVIVLIFFVTQIIYSQSAVKTPFNKSISKDAIQSFLINEMTTTKTAGMSFALINNSEIVYTDYLGYSRPEKQVTASTIFEGASLSKPVFAYFVMQFVEQGIIDLDKELYTYLPYKDIAHDKRYKKITARMVLSHKTGFPNWRTDTPGDSLYIDFEPGTKFQYSGEGYQYLAMVLQHQLKTNAKGLQELFHKNVAQPLDLNVTRYISNQKNQKNKAQAYKNNTWEELYNQGDHEFGAAYGINSNAEDFSKWIIALMNKKGLNENSFGELFRLQTALPEDNLNRQNGVLGLTLGFYSGELPIGPFYGHGGNNSKRFTSLFMFMPKQKWGFVLFTNSGAGENIGIKLFQFLASYDSKP